MRRIMTTITCDRAGCQSRYVPDPAEPDTNAAAVARGWTFVPGPDDRAPDGDRHFCPACRPKPEPAAACPSEYTAG